MYTAWRPFGSAADARALARAGRQRTHARGVWRPSAQLAALSTRQLSTVGCAARRGSAAPSAARTHTAWWFVWRRYCQAGSGLHARGVALSRLGQRHSLRGCPV